MLHRIRTFVRSLSANHRHHHPGGRAGRSLLTESRDCILNIEPLEQRTLLAADFGDAPNTYSTLVAENGAQHTASGPTLGATRDTETDGTHSPNADADGADEDGVTFGTTQVGQLGAAVTVNVQGGAAKLDAWIDFNGDGSWGGPGEQIFDSVAVVVGNNFLSFDAPSWAADGVTYARFRVSTAGDLGVGGLAADGEVEDYAVTIVPPAVASGTFAGQSIISTSANGVYSVFAADVDGDGDLDVLSASYSDDKIAWYENDGTQNFVTHTITTGADGAGSVFAADVDGDGDLDVLSSSSYDDKLAWYENDGTQNFVTHTITTGADGAASIFAADVDGDGDLDVLSASFWDHKIAWYENDGTQSFTSHTITIGALFAVAVFAMDVDGDGDTDVLSGSYANGTIAWYQNDGSQQFTTHTVATSSSGGVRSVFASDVDGDGDADVLSASDGDDKIAWYENDGSGIFTTHTITTGADGARSVFATDVDGDGDTDVLSASRYDDKIAWYENDGSQNFTTHTISTAADGISKVFAADVDGDGDMDVLSSSYYDDKIAWYENQNLVSTVVGRHIFYNQSVWDGNSALISAVNDNAAIATDKSAYIPGAGTAVFANITSFSRGINGIMVDLSGTGHTGITLANVANNFVFKVGNNNSPSSWTPAPAPSAISMIAGSGVSGSDRVEITWASGSINNKWLEVQVLAGGSSSTGLAATDVFFWGNKIADSGTGTPAGTFDTTTTDAAQVFATLGAGKPITDLRDYNRDGQVTTTDAAIVFANLGTITRISVGTAGPFAPEGDGDAGIASALASTTTTASTANATVDLPRGITHRLSNLDLNAGRIAALFQHLADQNTPGTRKILQKIDAVADDLGLKHELLDELLARSEF